MLGVRCARHRECQPSVLPMRSTLCLRSDPLALPCRTTSRSLPPAPGSTPQVWLHDLLPPGLADNLEAVRRRSVELEGVLKHQAGGRALLRCAVVDTDLRRAMYQSPFCDEGLEEAVGGGDDEQRALVQRLQSTTEAYSQTELRHKAMMSGGVGGAAGWVVAGWVGEPRWVAGGRGAGTPKRA